MKAIQIDSYTRCTLNGYMREIPQPRLRTGQVLIRTHAAGVNPIDTMIMRGEARILYPCTFPCTLGNELAGEVLAVGHGVEQFKTGDRVFGRLPVDSLGAFAEEVTVDASALALIPDYLSYQEAAAIPLVALTAMQALEILQLKEGDTLFISGGSGGFGAIAIPLAIAQGLRVYTSGSTANRERVEALGVERYLDYNTEDYVDHLHDMAGVIDTIGGNETARHFKVLRRGGRLVSLKGMPNGRYACRMGLPLWKRILFALVGCRMDGLAACHQQEYHFINVEANGAQLQQAAEILERHHVVPTIDATFPLEHATDALRKVAYGNSRGKTILTFHN